MCMCERVSVCVSVRVWWGGLTGHPPLRAGRGRSVAPLGGPGSRDIPPTAAAPCPVVGSVSPRSVSAAQGRGSHVRPRCTPGRLRQTEEEQTAGGGGCGVILGRWPGNVWGHPPGLRAGAAGVEVLTAAALGCPIPGIRLGPVAVLPLRGVGAIVDRVNASAAAALPGSPVIILV